MHYDDMITGRFYFQGDVGITLEQRVEKAAQCYLEKAGSFPNRAHVNPKVCNVECTVQVDGHEINVYPDPMMLEAITWIGIGKPKFKIGKAEP